MPLHSARKLVYLMGTEMQHGPGQHATSDSNAARYFIGGSVDTACALVAKSEQVHAAHKKRLGWPTISGDTSASSVRE